MRKDRKEKIQKKKAAKALEKEGFRESQVLAQQAREERLEKLRTNQERRREKRRSNPQSRSGPDEIEYEENADNETSPEKITFRNYPNKDFGEEQEHPDKKRMPGSFGARIAGNSFFRYEDYLHRQVALGLRQASMGACYRKEDPAIREKLAKIISDVKKRGIAKAPS